MAIRSRKKLVWGLGIITVLGLVTGGIVARASKKPLDSEGKNAPIVLEFAAADLTRVEARPLRPLLRVSGSLQPVHQAVVRARGNGEIRFLGPREGEPARAGEVLAQLDTSDLDARLQEKIGNLESGRAQLALAEKNRGNQQALLQQGFISQNAYDSAASTLEVHRGTQQMWQAQVQLARNALRDATVKAPLGGVVARRHVQLGERVALDAPLYTLVDLGQLEFQAPVPAADLHTLQAGMSVELAIDGFPGERFSGRLSRINPATEPGTRSILVYVHLDNPGGRIKAGMFASGDVLLAATPPVPTLPVGALRQESGESYAWIVVDGKLNRRSVRVGQLDLASGRVEIQQGIPENAWVLVGKFDLLRDGQAARIKSESGSPLAAKALSAS